MIFFLSNTITGVLIYKQQICGQIINNARSSDGVSRQVAPVRNVNLRQDKLAQSLLVYRLKYTAELLGL